MTAMKISAFPKCWIDEINTGKMDLFDWIETSTMLECEGLELLPSFLRHPEDPAYVARVRKAVEDRGMVIAPGMWPAGAVQNTKYSRQAYKLGKSL